MKRILAILLMLPHSGIAQDTAGRSPVLPLPDPGAVIVSSNSFSSHSKVNTKRQWLVGGVTTGIYAGMFVGLNAAWYQNYPRSSFHTFNDAREWQQMDKIGHAWTVYTASRLSHGMYDWAGMKNNKAVLYATASALAYMMSIEYLDGRSREWGWSWADAGANAFGAGLFAAQQLAWKEQKAYLKFSAHRNRYDAATLARANELFGKSLPQRLLKDYNAQAYWVSLPLPRHPRIPAWLRVSIGYGASGMLGGYENEAYDKDGVRVFYRPDIKRRRQWYIAPDIDLTKIRTRSRFLQSVFFTLNSLKFPAPALEFSDGKFRGHLLYF